MSENQDQGGTGDLQKEKLPETGIPPVILPPGSRPSTPNGISGSTDPDAIAKSEPRAPKPAAPETHQTDIQTSAGKDSAGVGLDAQAQAQDIDAGAGNNGEGPPPPPEVEHPAAYRVRPARAEEAGPNELYFWKIDTWKGPVPVEQDEAVMALEHFGSVMRQALAAEPHVLDLYFRKLATVAAGAFNGCGFNPQALRQLETYKQEIVRKVGPGLRAAYLRKTRNVAVGAAIVIMAAGFGLEMVLNLLAQPAPASAPGATPVPGFSIFNAGLLLGSSMIGLLFASLSRGMNLTFDDLLTPLEDLLPPWIRFTFYGIAIFLLGAAFQIRWFTISTGEGFSTAVINQSWIAAILFGLILGIAERAVPERVIKLGADVLRSSDQGSAAGTTVTKPAGK
jgi:hypothetical protein